MRGPEYDRTMKSRSLTLVLALALGVPALGGCGALSGSSCLPRLSVEPSHASPGDTITVKSADTCDAPMPQGGWVIGAGHVGGGVDSLVSVTTDQTFDGSFSVRLTLPESFPVGESFAGVKNWDYSNCGSAVESCASASGNFYVDP